MGTIEKDVKCETCSMDYTKCKGHFGQIALAVPVVNSICLKQLKWIVKHICKKCKRIVITNKDESFNDDLTCQLSEIIKANNLVKKFLSSGMRPNAKDFKRLVFRINTYYGNRKKRAGFLTQVMHSRE